MTLDNMTGITEGSYTGFCKSQLITCNRVKECNGVCPFEDALKHADKMQTMNEQHTVDHDKEWIIGCIEHDGFIKTDRFDKANQIILDALSAEAVQGWIPCSERLPKINQRVLLATNEERVFVGYKEKPDIVWRVTEADGREHWVYDPENYTDDIDVLPKDENCGFAKDDVYADGFLSVTSINYDDRFEGVIAWMPLPKPYREESEVEE